MRVFIAALLPEEMKLRIAAYVDSIKPSVDGARWEKPDKHHITLKFLGEVGESRLAELESLLRDTARRYTAFDTETTVLGGFPNLHSPRVLYLGLSRNETLDGLYEYLESGMEELGFKREGRKFIPHVTIGRVKSRFNASSALPVPGKSSFRVREIGIIKSIFHRGGSVYEPVSVHTLGE